MEQWTVAREFRYRLKQSFEQEGIWVGVPQQTLGFRNTLELGFWPLKNVCGVSLGLITG